MKELDDKALRQQLIERYLDAETTPEEELALADFYRQSQDTLAANEEAVARFLDHKIGFLDIYDDIEKAMRDHKVIPDPTVDEILEAEKNARAAF